MWILLFSQLLCIYDLAFTRSCLSLSVNGSKHVLCIVHSSQLVIKSKRYRATDTKSIHGCIDKKYIRHKCIIDRSKEGSKKNRCRDIEGNGNRGRVEAVMKLKPFKNQC